MSLNIINRFVFVIEMNCVICDVLNEQMFHYILFWVMTNLMHSFLMYLFLCLYMFRAASAHHQEDQTVLIHHLA
jgi:hypothetical protein